MYFNSTIYLNRIIGNIMSKHFMKCILASSFIVVSLLTSHFPLQAMEEDNKDKHRSGSPGSLSLQNVTTDLEDAVRQTIYGVSEKTLGFASIIQASGRPIDNDSIADCFMLSSQGRELTPEGLQDAAKIRAGYASDSADPYYGLMGHHLEAAYHLRRNGHVIDSFYAAAANSIWHARFSICFENLMFAKYIQEEVIPDTFICPQVFRRAVYLWDCGIELTSDTLLNRSYF